MKQALADERERAAANSTLLSVLRRMASPLRHDLAGAVLIPSLRLQMLRRQLGTTVPEPERLQAMVDEVIVALDALRKVQAGACGWLEQRDDTPVLLSDALAMALATFNLPFSARGMRIDNRGASAPQSSSLSYPAQPLHLLLHASCFLALDHAPATSILVVDCTAEAGGARVRWHFEAEQAAADEERLDADFPLAGIDATGERLTPVGVAALCRTFGARFESDCAQVPVLGTLYLPPVLNTLLEPPR